MPRHSGQTQRLIRRLTWDEIDPFLVKKNCSTIPRGRYQWTGTIIASLVVQAILRLLYFQEVNVLMAALVARQSMTLAGLKLIPIILGEYGAGWRLNLNYEDGESVDSGAVIAKIEGPIQELLMAERIVLNFVQKLTGVATLTKTYTKLIQSASTRILDTRKTTPGFRVLEKYAVGQGGGYSHRLGSIRSNHDKR
jgi:nicotinate-nucleotide pyrophosphorylase (carboxylating)